MHAHTPLITSGYMVYLCTIKFFFVYYLFTKFSFCPKVILNIAFKTLGTIKKIVGRKDTINV